MSLYLDDSVLGGLELPQESLELDAAGSLGLFGGLQHTSGQGTTIRNNGGTFHENS